MNIDLINFQPFYLNNMILVLEIVDMLELVMDQIKIMGKAKTTGNNGINISDLVISITGLIMLIVS